MDFLVAKGGHRLRMINRVLNKLNRPERFCLGILDSSTLEMVIFQRANHRRCIEHAKRYMATNRGFARAVPIVAYETFGGSALK